MTKINIENLIKKHNIDFIDFGSSKGGSINLGIQIFGGENGLGIDIDAEKIKGLYQITL